MKILTLNTHSYMEDNFESKYNTLIDCLIKEEFDIIAFQEVNQLEKSRIVNQALNHYYVSSNQNINIKIDNFALKVINSLSQQNLNYYWSYLPMHIGYDKFDEGVALLSKYPIENTNIILLSQNDNYRNYKNRKTLGIKVNGVWYYSIHLGWWNDAEDPMQAQINTLINKIDMSSTVFLMGDFNCPAEKKDEGYDYILNNFPFYDTHKLAKKSYGNYTIVNTIDGWNATKEEKLRIDLILKNNNLPIDESNVIFDGTNYDIVSDHFGLSIVNKKETVL